MASPEAVCQICLALGERLNLFPIISDNSKISLQILMISGVQVIDNKACPALICFQCMQDLHVADSLRKKCIEAAERNSESFIQSDFFKDNSKLNPIDIGNRNEEEHLTVKISEAVFNNMKNYDRSYSSPHEVFFDEQLEAESIKPKVCRKKVIKSSPKSRRKPNDSSGPRVLKCEHCPKTFKWPYTLREHQQVMHSSEPAKLFECDQCGKKKKTYLQIKHHVTLHEKYNKFFCNVCGYGTNLSSSIKAHERTHQTEKLICEICKKPYKNKLSLKAHIAAVHEKTFTGTCPHCPYVTSWHYTMKKHISEVHCNVKRFKCTECDWKFYRMTGLKRHMRTHTGEKPFKCENIGCGRDFCDLKGKRNHMEKCCVLP